MPYRMHSQYLRKLYLDNAFVGGRLVVDGRPALFQNIHAPMFVVGTERDHVAPWRSVFKVHDYADADVTFVLAGGGHNVGIVSDPRNTRNHYRIALKRRDDPTVGPDEWVLATQQRAGPWWLAWIDWLASQSSGPASAPPMGSDAYPPLADAPGT
jgi:polyhydroxyalkanoate synthase